MLIAIRYERRGDTTVQITIEEHADDKSGGDPHIATFAATLELPEYSNREAWHLAAEFLRRFTAQRGEPLHAETIA